MSDCKIGFHLINPVFNGEVGTALEAFDLALHTFSGTALGCLEGRNIDYKFGFTSVIDVFTTFLLIRIFIRVIGGFARRQGKTAFASGLA